MKLLTKVAALLLGTQYVQQLPINIIPTSSVSGNGELAMKLLMKVADLLLGTQYVQQLPINIIPTSYHTHTHTPV